MAQILTLQHLHMYVCIHSYIYIERERYMHAYFAIYADALSKWVCFKAMCEDLAGEDGKNTRENKEKRKDKMKH